MSRRGLALAAALALVLAACGDDSGGDQASGGVRPTVRATPDGECTLSGGDVGTGLVEFSLVNDSRDPLYVVTFRIDEGQTFEDVLAAPPELGPPDFVTRSGGVTKEVAPGGRATDTLAFTDPGEYALICITDLVATAIPFGAEPLHVTG